MNTTLQQQHTAHYDHQARRAAQRAAQPALSGATIVRLMRQNGKTIRGLAASMGITQVRVREVRAAGVNPFDVKFRSGRAGTKIPLPAGVWIPCGTCALTGMSPFLQNPNNIYYL